MFVNPHIEWYSIHVPAGLPEQIARAASEHNMTPGEYLAHLVRQTNSGRTTARPSRNKPHSRSTGNEHSEFVRV